VFVEGRLHSSNDRFTILWIPGCGGGLVEREGELRSDRPGKAFGG